MFTIGLVGAISKSGKQNNRATHGLVSTTGGQKPDFFVVRNYFLFYYDYFGWYL